jgi:asparagine synthase (glutamine-hydrolysing)
MCGIAGILDFRAGRAEPHVLQSMCAAMRHRGPDDEGFHVEGPVGLGIRRLRIIDLERGDQPIYNEDRSVAVVLNGEIYNFPELRAELEGRGHRFASRSDTEVLVHLYEDLGTRLVERLKGMFAFALWDSRSQTLMCARDRVGKKPLYYCLDDGRLRFASELWALLQDPTIARDVDVGAINRFLAFGYVPGEQTAFARIRRLPPATVLTAQPTGISQSTYWTLDFSNKTRLSFDEAAERTRELLAEATRRRLISDVPLGAFLSGGIDSSCMVAAMSEVSSQVKTFSAAFRHAEFNEAEPARRVAQLFGTDHTELEVEADTLELMPKLARHYGQPFADPSAVPTFALAEVARQHVTVALNGDGGDEAFAGYPRYTVNAALARGEPLVRGLRPLVRFAAAHMPDGATKSDWRSRVKRAMELLSNGTEARYASWIGPLGPSWRDRLLTPEFAAAVHNDPHPEQELVDLLESSDGEVLDRMLAADIRHYLPDDLLVKVDIASMAYSLEARSPYLDHELLEFAASLPPTMKMRGRQRKRVLREAYRGVLPDQVLNRSKMGFGVPLVHWFRSEQRELPYDVLLDDEATSRGIFRTDQVRTLIAEHAAGRVDHSSRIWTLLQLEFWFREVVERRPAPMAGAAS